MKKQKDEILRLRAEGKSYREIIKITGASGGTVCYHCGKGQKEKTQKRKKKRYSKVHPFTIKIERFKTQSMKNKDKNTVLNNMSINRKIYQKIQTFHRDRITGDYSKMSFTVQDVIDKYGTNTTCYLTGDKIDIYKPKTYQFDHIIPVSKGGENTLDNLGICTKEANISKTDHTLEEFIELCKKVVKTHCKD